MCASWSEAEEGGVEGVELEIEGTDEELWKVVTDKWSADAENNQVYTDCSPS